MNQNQSYSLGEQAQWQAHVKMERAASRQPAVSNNAIPHALACIAEAVTGLDGAVQELAQRMHGVLTPVPPSPEAASTIGVAPPPHGFITQEVEQTRRRVDAIRATVDDLLNRLEV